MTTNSKKRSSYTDEFKKDAVALVTEQGYKISEAARSLDIGANLLRRWQEHVHGSSRFTKGHPPIRVIHVQDFASRNEAERRERQLKGWTRAKKLALSQGDLERLKIL